jgi:hypothetical protein
MSQLLMTLVTVIPTIAPTATPIPTASSSPAFDLSISIAVIIAITALISPILVAIINNRHQFKMKKMEYEETQKLKKLEIQSDLQRHQWDTYYNKSTIVFEELANNVGNYLGYTADIEAYSKALGSINQARIYADKELQGYLDILMGDVMAFDNDIKTPNQKPNKGSALCILGEVIQSANRMITIKD